MSRDRRWLLLAVALASACAAQHEEPTGTAFDGEAERSVDAPPAEPAPAAEAKPDDDAGEPSLATFERELAANEAKLRQLGVALPSDANTLAGGDAAPTETEKESKRDDSRKGGGAGAGGMVQPSARPGTAPSADLGGTKTTRSDRSEGGSGRGKDKQAEKKAEDVDDGFAAPPPAPDPAKAAPPTPNQSPELDAAMRCQQVCDLGQITCELSVQICELADRHVGEDDYLSACERASEDCSAAQEACDACEA